MKISIGIPIYNAAPYVERCARSIFGQTYDDLDIVFVDDCSPDDSSDIIRRVLADYPHRKAQTRIIRHDHNRGVSAARNTLLDAFQGDFFSFVDADDYLMPNATKLLAEKQHEGDYDIVTGNIIVQHNNSTDKIDAPNFNNADEMLYHIVSQPANHSNFARLYRTSIVRRNDLKFINGMIMGEDWVFLTAFVLHVNSLGTIADVVYTYDYTNESSAMHRLANSEAFAKYMLADTVTCHEMKKMVISKGSVFVDAVEKMMAKRIEDGLLAAYKRKDRRTFSAIKKYIPEVSPRNVSRDYHFRKLYFFKRIYPETYSVYFWIKKNILKRVKN